MLPSRLFAPASVRGRAPTLTRPTSQACTQAQFEEEAYRHWCARIREEPRLHRKQWEFCFILQALATEGVLSPGFRALGFGVGGEPLPAVFADMGVHVLATDLATEAAAQAGWVSTGQHADGSRLNERGICPPHVFADRVRFRVADMTDPPADLQGFDFCWSACALEHLGSIEAGLAFVRRTVGMLRPGGVAVHTTELNCGEGRATLEAGDTVLFRPSDLRRLARSLPRGARMAPLNLHLGDGAVDGHVDAPPFGETHHLKLQLGGFVTTSFGLIIRREG